MHLPEKATLFLSNSDVLTDSRFTQTFI